MGIMADINEKIQNQGPGTSTTVEWVPAHTDIILATIVPTHDQNNPLVWITSYTHDGVATTLRQDYVPNNINTISSYQISASTVTYENSAVSIAIYWESVKWTPTAVTILPSNPTTSSGTKTSFRQSSITTTPAPTSTKSPGKLPTPSSSSSTERPFPTNPPSPEKSGLPSGAIAGIVIALILFLTGAAFAFWFICYRRRRRSYPVATEEYGYIGETSTSPSSTDPAFTKSVAESNILPVTRGLASRVKLSELPLDDPAMKKVMDNLDHLVTDHITTYILKEDIDSYEYQEIFDSPAVIPALKNIFAKDRLLVASRSAGAGAPTVNEMRAIFAYYIFTALIDWRSLSERERQDYFSGNKPTDQRQTFFRRTERSEGEMERRSSLVCDMLERDIMPFVPKSMVSDELRQAHLKEIATSIVVVSFKLGLQKDTFKFDFRNKDSPIASISGDNRLAIRALGGTAVDEAHMEIVGETKPGAVVRAMLSPGVLRVPEGQEKENQVRKMKVITS